MKHLIPVLSIAFTLTGCLKMSDRTLVELDKGELAQPPKLITLKMSNYRPTSGRNFKEIFVSNFSVKAAQGKIAPSYSRDGLSNDLKAKLYNDYTISNTGPYSANPYFSDLMLYLSGIRYTQQNLLYCSPSLTQSLSNDAIYLTDSRSGPPVQAYYGLRDCEKSYLGLKPDTFDFDKDAIPDYLELRCGLNPKNGNDASLNPTGDGVTHLEKCKRNIQIDESADSAANKLYSYQYKIQIEQNGSRTITISNIPVDATENLIAFYLVEIDPSTTRTYLFTAFARITPDDARAPTYNFNFWSTGPGNQFNQEVVFP